MFTVCDLCGIALEGELTRELEFTLGGGIVARFDFVCADCAGAIQKPIETVLAARKAQWKTMLRERDEPFPEAVVVSAGGIK